MNTSVRHDQESEFDRRAHTWHEIPGWFEWRQGQEEAVAHFPGATRFVEVGCYLGRSICSLAEVVRAAGHSIQIVGVDTGRGNGPEGIHNIDFHGDAVDHGGGTFAGLLHRNIIGCGFVDDIQLVISDSVAAAALFADASLAWVHIDACHEYASVNADINAWAPKVQPGGWLSGDDYKPEEWPGLVAAVNETLPSAHAWCSTQWRWIKPNELPA